MIGKLFKRHKKTEPFKFILSDYGNSMLNLIDWINLTLKSIPHT